MKKIEIYNEDEALLEYLAESEDTTIAEIIADILQDLHKETGI